MQPTEITIKDGRKLIVGIQPDWMKNYKTQLIYAYGLITRYYDETENGFGCAECCTGDRCDEDIEGAKYCKNAETIQTILKLNLN